MSMINPATSLMSFLTEPGALILIGVFLMMAALVGLLFLYSRKPIGQIQKEGTTVQFREPGTGDLLKLESVQRKNGKTLVILFNPEAPERRWVVEIGKAVLFRL